MPPQKPPRFSVRVQAHVKSIHVSPASWSFKSLMAALGYPQACMDHVQFLPSRERSHIPPNGKIIDSNIPWVGICVSSQEGKTMLSVIMDPKIQGECHKKVEKSYYQIKQILIYYDRIWYVWTWQCTYRNTQFGWCVGVKLCTMFGEMVNHQYRLCSLLVFTSSYIHVNLIRIGQFLWSAVLKQFSSKSVAINQAWSNNTMLIWT